jgi:glycosyltransferase involved in cell wall biosynthesis
MDTGGGPLTIKRIVEDFPAYSYYVSGNPGVYMEHFKKILPASNILGLRGPNLLLNLRLLISFCRQHKIDILHVHGRGAASFARFVKLFIPRIKIIYTPNGFFPKSLSFPLRSLYVIGERILFTLTDLVFFVSESEQETFSKSLKLNIHNRKFIYIQNYINSDLTVIKPPIPYQHPFAQRPRYLFIGRLSMQKGIDILMESLKLVKGDFQVSIIGYGEMEDYLKLEIEKSFKDKVAFVGKVNEAFRYMPNFDALLLPSRFEGLPFTILEAMLYRLPLIVTPCNGTIDLVKNDNGYVAKGIDANSFATAVDAFSSDFQNNRDKIQYFINTNYTKVTKEYSKEAVQEKIKRLYS